MTRAFNDIKWDVGAAYEGKQYFLARVHTEEGDGIAVWTDATKDGPQDLAVVFGHEYRGETINEIIGNGIMKELADDHAAWRREPSLIDSMTSDGFPHIPVK